MSTDNQVSFSDSKQTIWDSYQELLKRLKTQKAVVNWQKIFNITAIFTLTFVLATLIFSSFYFKLYEWNWRFPIILQSPIVVNHRAPCIMDL